MLRFRSAAFATLWVSLSAAVPGVLIAQAMADADPRTPRFLLAVAGTRKPIDVQRTPALSRHIALDFNGETLAEALAVITRRSGLRLAYTEDVLPRDARVQLRASEISVAGALSTVLLDAGVDVVFTSGARASLVKRVAVAPPAVGSVVGRVTEAETGQGIGDVEVLLEGSRWRTLTGADGQYRLVEVDTGNYLVIARRIGYTRQSRSVTVVDGQEAMADFALAQAPTQLDELVTLSPGGLQTEARALSSPVTVVTAEDIEAQQPQTINQIFRQLVPSGVGFVSASQPVATNLSVRGASSISAGSVIKVFIDGVEVADRGISPVDPSSIERIEVVRGPQATTLYGPDAAGGVLQIFTKRGAGPPRIDLRAQAGVLQTPYPTSRSALSQEYHASLTGGGSDVSYTFGGSYTHLDDWLPLATSTAQSILSGFGGIRYASGMVTLDLSSRYMRSVLPLEQNPDLLSTGFLPFSRPAFDVQTWENQTYSARAGVAPTPWWQNQLTVGVDRSTLDQSPSQRRLTTPADTFFSVFSNHNSKLSLQLNSAVTPRLSADVTGSLIAGIDYYRLDQDITFVAPTLNTSGTIQTAPGAFVNLSNDRTTNTGYFAQAQVGWRETLFLNGGLRADDNSNFGADLGTPVQPRVGLSAVLQSANVTLKLRGAYGRAIRAPGIGVAAGFVQAFSTQLANPFLRPERQRGWDAGADLIFGGRGSLGLTWYDQIADDLIVSVVTEISPVFTNQHRNVGRVANRGLEVEGTLNLHPLQLRAQYAYTDSRIEDLGSAEGTGLTVGGRPTQTPVHTAGATLTAAPWRTGDVSLGVTYVGGYRSLDVLAFARCLGGTGPCPTPIIFSNIQRDYPSFAKANLNVTQRITSQVNGLLSIGNLTNNMAFEGANLGTVKGRTTMVGLHARF